MKNLKLHNVCSTDELREQMQCVAIIGDYFYATNGHVLVRLHRNVIGCTFDESSSKRLIHRQDWYFLTQCDIVHFGTKDITFIRKNGTKGTMLYRPLDEYPDCEKIIQKALKDIEKSKLSHISFNTDLIGLIAKCFDFYQPSKSVDFFISKKNNLPMLMKPAYEIDFTNQLGLLMPTMPHTTV